MQRDPAIERRIRHIFDALERHKAALGVLAAIGASRMVSLTGLRHASRLGLGAVCIGGVARLAHFLQGEDSMCVVSAPDGGACR